MATENNLIFVKLYEGCNLTTTTNFTGTIVVGHRSGRWLIRFTNITQETNDVPNLQCNALINNNAGCGITEWSRASYGPYFDSQGGGVFAMKWDSSGIAVCQFMTVYMFLLCLTLAQGHSIVLPFPKISLRVYRTRRTGGNRSQRLLQPTAIFHNISPTTRSSSVRPPDLFTLFKLTLSLDITFCGKTLEHVKSVPSLICPNKVTGLAIPIQLPDVLELVPRY